MALLVLATFATGPTNAAATFPARNGDQIAFTVSGDRDDVYLMDANGRNERNVTGELPDGYVAGPWAPDGKSMLVTSGRDAPPVLSWWEADIFLFIPRTGEMQNLTQTPVNAREVEPTWSPDGTQIAFTTWRIVGPRGQVDFQIDVMNVDGSDRRELVRGFAPSWSPDGARIAYTAWPSAWDDAWGGAWDDATGEIATISLDGDQRSVLTKSPFSTDPDWSPDGSRIVYARDSSRMGQSDIFVMNADGDHIRRLTNSRGLDRTPRWSPDGRFVLFSKEVRDGDPDRVTSEVFRIASSGGPVRRLTNIGQQADYAHWRPVPR